MPLEIREFAADAGAAGGVLGYPDRLEVAAPNIRGDEPIVKRFFAAGEKFEGFGDFERGDEIDDGAEDANGVAGFFDALAACRGFEQASETSSQAGADGHGYAITGDGGGVNPGATRMDGKIIDEETSLEIVGAIEDEIEAREQLRSIGRV